MGALKKIYDQGKVLLLGDEQAKYETLLPQPGTRAGPELMWGGQAFSTAAYYNTPITTVCTTSEGPSDFMTYKPEPPLKRWGEWRCEGCGSVMLSEHRKCEECGTPRHFLYSVADD